MDSAKTVTVTLAENREMDAGSNDDNGSNSDHSKTDALDGVTVGDLDADARGQLKIPDDVQGALVTDVDQDSNSADAGLQKGDVIVEINHQPVTDADDAIKLCDNAKGDQILLKIWRREDNLAGTRYRRGQHEEKVSRRLQVKSFKFPVFIPPASL